MNKDSSGVSSSSNRSSSSSRCAYWAEDHDAQVWAAEFGRLASLAHRRKGGGKDKKALADYRSMRLDIAAQTRRMTRRDDVSDSDFSGAVAAPKHRAPSEAASISVVASRRGVEAHADPLAVASHVGCPLLLPLRHGGPSADGDLESECRRRCLGGIHDAVFSGQGGATATVATKVGKRCFDVDVDVARGPESGGYKVLPRGQVWVLRLVAYENLRSERRLPSLRVSQGREQLKNTLYMSLFLANERRALGGTLLLAGIPFCHGNGDEDDEHAAEITIQALRKAGVHTLLLAGRNAQGAFDVFRATKGSSASLKEKEGEEEFVRICMWNGDLPKDDTDRDHMLYM